MRIWNFTPHSLNFYSESDTTPAPKIRKLIINTGAKPVLTVPSDGMLNAKIDYVKVDSNLPIVEYAPKVTAVDSIPENIAEDDIVVVSALYISAYRIVHGTVDPRFRTISNPVYENESNPRPIGCLGVGLPI